MSNDLREETQSRYARIMKKAEALIAEGKQPRDLLLTMCSGGKGKDGELGAAAGIALRKLGYDVPPDLRDPDWPLEENKEAALTDADKFERLLTELMALDERHHLEILLSAAQDLVSAIEQNLAGQPTTGEEEEVAFCLSQLDAAKGMLIHRQDTMHELRYSRSPDCCSDVIPF